MGIFTIREEQDWENSSAAVAAEPRDGLLTIESVALAFACPLRSMYLTSDLAEGQELLQVSGKLNQKEVQRFKRILERDFYITSAADFQKHQNDLTHNAAWLINRANTKMKPMEEEYFRAMMVAYSSLELFGLMTAIEVGYTSWLAVERIVIKRLQAILLSCGVESWRDFANYFLEGQKYLGISSMKTSEVDLELYDLIYNLDSPWQQIDLDRVRQIWPNVIHPKQFYL